MYKFVLPVIALALSTASGVFASDEEPKHLVEYLFDKDEDKLSDDETIKHADRFWSEGEEEKAIDLYNQIIAKDSDERKDKKQWAKAVLRRSFLYASLDDLDKSMEGLSKLLDDEKSKKFFKKARKYSKLLANAGDKDVVKQLVFLSTTNYLDKLLTALDEEETKTPSLGFAG